MTDTRRVSPAAYDSCGMTDKEMEDLLDSPETDEERQALDGLEKDPERIVAEARARAREKDG